MERKYPHLLSYDKLPRILFPQPGVREQPPVYHWGWVVDREWIIRYAGEHQLLELNDAPEECFSLGSDIDTDSASSCDAPGEEGIVVGLTTGKVCEAIPKNAGIAAGSLDLRWEVVYGDDMESNRICFALSSNYDEASGREIPATDVRAIREHLGQTKGPRWHLDLLDAEWDDQLES